MRNLDHLSALDSITLRYYGILKIYLKNKNESLIYVNDQHVIQSRLMLTFSSVLSFSRYLHTSGIVKYKNILLQQKWNCSCFIIKGTNLLLASTLPLMALVLVTFPSVDIARTCCCSFTSFSKRALHNLFQCLLLSCHSCQLYAEVAYSIVDTFITQRTVYENKTVFHQLSNSIWKLHTVFKVPSLLCISSKMTLYIANLNILHTH